MASGCPTAASLPPGFVEVLEEIVQSVITTQPSEPLEHIAGFLEILLDRRTLLQMQARHESPECGAQTTAKFETPPQKASSATKPRRPRPVKKTSKKGCSASEGTLADDDASAAGAAGAAGAYRSTGSCNPWQDPFIIASHRAQHDALRHVIGEIEAVNNQIMELEESVEKGTRGAPSRQLALKHSQLQRTLQKLPLVCGWTYGQEGLSAGCQGCQETTARPCRGGTRRAARPKEEGGGCCQTEKYQKEFEQRMTCLKDTMEQVIRSMNEGGFDPSKKPATRRTPNQQKVEYERLLQDLGLLNQWLQNMSESISQDGSACKTPETVFHLQILDSSLRRAARRAGPKADAGPGQQQQAKGKDCMAAQYYIKDAASGKVTMVEAGSRELLAQIQGQPDKPRADSLPYPKTLPAEGEDPTFPKYNSDSLLLTNNKSNVMKGASRPCVGGGGMGSSTAVQDAKVSSPMHLTSSQTNLACKKKSDIEPPPMIVAITKGSSEAVGQRSTEKVRSTASVNSRETIQTVKSATSKSDRVPSNQSIAKSSSFRDEKVSSHQSIAKTSSFRDEKVSSHQSIAKTSSFRDEKVSSHQSIAKTPSIRDEREASCQSIAKTPSIRDEKVSSYQSIAKVPSIREEKVSSHQSIAKTSSFRDEKVSSHQSIAKTPSIRDEKVSSHQSIAKTSSFRDEKVSSHQSIAKAPSIRDEDSCQYIAKTASFRDEKDPSCQYIPKTASFRDEKDSSCQYIPKIASLRDERVSSHQSISKTAPIRDEKVPSHQSVTRVQKMESNSVLDPYTCNSGQSSVSSMVADCKTQQRSYVERGDVSSQRIDPQQTSHHSGIVSKQATQQSIGPAQSSHHSGILAKQATQQSIGPTTTSTTTTTTKKTTTIRMDPEPVENAFSQMSVESVQGTTTASQYSNTGRDVRIGTGGSGTQRDRYTDMDPYGADCDIEPPMITLRAHKNASETSVGSLRLSNNPSINSSGIQSF